MYMMDSNLTGTNLLFEVIFSQILEGKKNKTNKCNWYIHVFHQLYRKK